MTEQIKKIEDKVKSLIQEGKIKMKPRWFFVLKSILKILFIVVLFLILVYFISFANFIVNERIVLNGGPEYGGWAKFLFGIPWLIIFLSFVMLFLLEVLVRKYSFVYRRPLVYSLFFIVFLIFIMGFMLIKLDKRKNVPRFGEDKNIPLFTPMHKYYRKEYKDFRHLEKSKNLNKINDFKPQKNFEIFQ